MEEIITTTAEEVVEATEEIATACSDNFGKGVAVGAVAAMVGVIAYDYVIKPLAKKLKEKAQQRKAKEEAMELDAEGYDIPESDFTEEE